MCHCHLFLGRGRRSRKTRGNSLLPSRLLDSERFDVLSAGMEMERQNTEFQSPPGRRVSSPSRFFNCSTRSRPGAGADSFKRRGPRTGTAAAGRAAQVSHGLPRRRQVLLLRARLLPFGSCSVHLSPSSTTHTLAGFGFVSTVGRKEGW